MPDQIFITGGSGFIGPVVIEYAIAEGYNIRALSRSESSDDKLRAIGAIPVRGDLTSLELLKREATQADIVISLADALAGNYSTMTMEERARINDGALQALAAGLQGSGKPFLITSGSLTVAADPDGRETTESSPRWKKALFGEGSEPFGLSLKDKDIRVCAIRLAPWVYGRGGSGVALFMNMFAPAGEVIYVGDGSGKTTSVHVEDAARLYILAAKYGKSGEAYNATSETDVTFRQLAETMAATMGISARSQSFADTEAKSGSFLAKFLSTENRASNAKARLEFGWQPTASKGLLEEISHGSYVQVAQDLQRATR